MPLANGFTDGAGNAHAALLIKGKIGPRAAVAFRQAITQAELAEGDLVVLSSPGGQVDQAMLMGEAIRARGLVTAVGAVDNTGRIRPSYCASACVLVFAGGKERLDVAGSRIGVHRFTTSGGDFDAVASAQGTMGRVLSYVTRMGVSSRLVEAMSATDSVRWLQPAEVNDMKVTTKPFHPAKGSANIKPDGA